MKSTDDIRRRVGMFVPAPEGPVLAEALVLSVVEHQMAGDATSVEVELVNEGIRVWGDVAPDLDPTRSERDDVNLLGLRFHGASWNDVVRALAATFTVTLQREGRAVRWVFKRGQLSHGPTEFPAADGRGVVVYEWKPDAAILGDGRVRRSALRTRLLEIVHLFPGLHAAIEGERFHASEGLLGLARVFARSETEPLLLDGVADGYHVQVALFDGAGTRAWWEGARVHNGTHVDGLHDALMAEGVRCGALLHVTGHECEFADGTRRTVRGQQLVPPWLKRWVGYPKRRSNRTESLIEPI